MAAAAEYATPRELLDDVVELVALGCRRARLAPTNDDEHRAVAELELELARCDERIAARSEAAAQRGRQLPLDRLREVFRLTATETRALAVLATLELSPRAREAAAALLAEPAAPATVGLLELLVYREPRAR